MTHPPYTFCLCLPLPVLVMIGYMTTHGIDVGYLPYWLAGMIVVGWGGAVWLWLRQRKIIAQRLFIDVRPDTVEAMDGSVFHQPFSSSTHFLSDPAAFQAAIKAVASRKKQFIYAREAVHVRIWPGELTLSQVELDRIMEIVDGEFIDPVFEMPESPAGATSALRA